MAEKVITIQGGADTNRLERLLTRGAYLIVAGEPYPVDEVEQGANGELSVIVEQAASSSTATGSNSMGVYIPIEFDAMENVEPRAVRKAFGVPSDEVVGTVDYLRGAYGDYDSAEVASLGSVLANLSKAFTTFNNLYQKHRQTTPDTIIEMGVEGDNLMEKFEQNIGWAEDAIKDIQDKQAKLKALEDQWGI